MTQFRQTDYLRRAVHALRLETRGGIGPLLLPVEPIKIERAKLNPFNDSLMIAARAAGKWY